MYIASSNIPEFIVLPVVLEVIGPSFNENGKLIFIRDSSTTDLWTRITEDGSYSKSLET